MSDHGRFQKVVILFYFLGYLIWLFEFLYFVGSFSINVFVKFKSLIFFTTLISVS